ncbi:hypothetical protein QFC21_004261 [Naganishia friedmannii]|uniref:Uncharacterized protein n=1 Tax=Naganishia friedmannii TaxID=89922 RepID=A0ACC2VHH2_9TREE|nr:hypothetical protein QFC21_004261 [Naganishia friedmannii]
MSTQTLRALTRELTTLTSSPPEGVRIHIANEGDLLGNGGVVGIVQGPSGTPYEGGYFRTIKCLLIVPNPESALDEEAGKLLLEDYQEYYKTPPTEFLDSTTSSNASSTSNNNSQAKASSLPLQPHKHAFINGTAAPPPSSTSQPNMPLKKVASGVPAAGSGGAPKASTSALPRSLPCSLSTSSRGFTASASTQYPRAYDKLRSGTLKEHANGNDPPEEDEHGDEGEGSNTRSVTVNLNAVHQNGAHRTNQSSRQGGSGGDPADEPSSFKAAPSQTQLLPSDFAEKYLTCSTPSSPRSPEDGSGAEQDPTSTYYDIQLKNQLLASFLPVNQQANLDPTLAVVCPIEGGEYIVRQTIEKAASLVHADVVRIEAIECLALRQFGGLGQAGASLQLRSNPALVSEEILTDSEETEDPPFIAIEEDGDESEHGGITIGQPIEISLPMPAGSAFSPPSGMPVVMMKGDMADEHIRRRNKAKIEKLFSDIVNVADQRHHNAPESSSQGAQIRPRIIYIQDAVAMASTFNEWFPALLKAVRARRRAGLAPNETQQAVSRSTTIVLGCSPSVLHTGANLRAKSESDAMAAEDQANATTTERPPMPPALMNFLNGIRKGGKSGSGGASNDVGEPWKASEEDDVVGRKRRLKRRLRRFRLSDERELRALLPDFGDGSERATEERPRMPGGVIDLSAMLGAASSARGRRSRANMEIGPMGDRDFARPWKVLGTLPIKRDIARERRERQNQRLRINSLLLRKAIGLQGGEMTTDSLADELSKDDPNLTSSVQNELVDIRDSFADSIWPWLTVQHLASITIGHTLASSATPGTSGKAFLPITWRAIAEASIFEEAVEGQAADFIANCSANEKRTASSDSQPSGDIDRKDAEPIRDPVVEQIKKDKTLNMHEKRLLGCIVDPTKLSSTSFDDVLLPDKTIDAVRSVVTLPLIYPEAFNTGILAQHATGNALLFGPPGTGKTLLARALARESGARMLAVQPSDVTDMYVGEGEKLVKAVFSLARRLSPCIVFLDEVDSLFGARSSQSSGGAQAHRQILTEFMQEMDGLSSASKNKEHRIVVIGATNRPYDLDEAVLRRLPRRLLVDLPGQKEREAILRILLKHEKLADDVDLNKIAGQTDTYSGSDLKHLCVSAALASLKETVHLPWKSNSSAWTPLPSTGPGSSPTGPSSPAYRHSVPVTETEEPQTSQPEEILPQPQMQRLRPSADETGMMEALAYQDPSFMLGTALQQLFSDQMPAMYLHGLASKVDCLEYKDLVSSHKDRPSDNKDLPGKSVYPIRRTEPQFKRTGVVQETTVKLSASVARQRLGYVDQLLKTQDYANSDFPAEIIKLLRDRLCRLAVFFVLAKEDLRTNSKLLTLVQETIFMELRSVAGGKPHDLAVRLGWTAKGRKWGAAREALHQQMVINQGRLPSMKEIEKAVVADNYDPHQRFDLMTSCSNLEQAIVTAGQHSVCSEPFTRTAEEWTFHYNQQLHKQILVGAKANQMRKDGQKAIHHPRPTGGLQQLSALLKKIQSLKRDRGFQPDWVTVNLVVKTWLRGISASKEGAAFGASDIFKAFKETVTMDIIKKQNLDFDRDIQPLVKMLVKALKGNGEWLKAREVLAWMVEIRDTMVAGPDHPERGEVTAAKPKGRTPKSGPGGNSLMHSIGEIMGGRKEEAEKAEEEAAVDKDDDEPSSHKPAARIITMKHFEIAMQEITPSSSESGNLPELRKWASQYGEGGTERGKKAGYGSKFGFGDEKIDKQEAGYGRVRPEDS